MKVSIFEFGLKKYGMFAVRKAVRTPNVLILRQRCQVTMSIFVMPRVKVVRQCYIVGVKS